MSDSIIVRVRLDSYDVLRPSEKQTQVYVQIPEVARASWLLDAEFFSVLRDEPWPHVVDSAREAYERRGVVSDSDSAAARAAIVKWLSDDANHDAMNEAWFQDRAQRDPVSRSLLQDKERLTARVAELEADYVTPSPSCTRCYGADAVRFVAQGGVTASCPVCDPSEVERLRARVAELETEAAAQRRTGFQVAIEVMRQEKLPMSVELLNAQLELEALDVPAPKDRPAGAYPPALPWAGLMDDEDLHDFLDVALAEVEATCGRWRAIAEAQHAHNTAPGPDVEADGITRRIVPVQALREDRPVEDPCHPCGCPKRFDRHADGCPAALRAEDTADILTLADAQHADATYNPPFQTIELELTATPDQWTAWQKVLMVDLARTTNRGSCVTSHATWRGIHVVIRCWLVKPEAGDA
jgi:hypothetical protein